MRTGTLRHEGRRPASRASSLCSSIASPGGPALSNSWRTFPKNSLTRLDNEVVTQPPVSDEIAGALGHFFFGGIGPSHTSLTGVFLRAGLRDADPYVPTEGTPSKEVRVQQVVHAAIRQPSSARKLIDGLLTQLRLKGSFGPDGPNYDPKTVSTAQTAFRRSGWGLSADGTLSPLGQIDLVTGGREALDEQLDRLRRSTDDPGQLLGSAKDLLEAIAKFVLEEWGTPQDADFNHLWFLARDRLGTHPKQVVADGPAADQVRKILGASWTIAEQVNELRNLQGAGHGRTLPTGVTPEIALLVVREACSVAQFTLSVLDRSLGR